MEEIVRNSGPISAERGPCSRGCTVGQHGAREHWPPLGPGTEGSCAAGLQSGPGRASDVSGSLSWNTDVGG